MEFSKTTITVETRSNESEDSDDEIIVKIFRPVDTNSNSLENKDRDSDNSNKNTDDKSVKLQGTIDEENCENHDETCSDSDAHGVFPKVQRGRMEFPPIGSESPTKNNSSCEHSLHKPNSSTTKLNHQGLSEDKTILQSHSAAAKKRTSCHVN